MLAMKTTRAGSIRRRGNAIMLSLLVVVGALAVVFLYNLWTNYVLGHEIEQLNKEARNSRLEADHLRCAFQKLNLSIEGIVPGTNSTLQEDHESFEENDQASNHSERIDKLEVMLASLRRELEAAKMVHVQSEPDSNETQVMQESLEKLTVELHQTRRTVNSIQSFADNTYKGLNSLGEQIQEHVKSHQSESSGISLSSICSTHRKSCTVPSSRQGQYWKSCRTPITSINEVGKVILSRECSFQPLRRFSEYQESLTLQEDGDRVWCDCDVTFPGEDGDRQRAIAEDFTGTCYLTIIHC